MPVKLVYRKAHSRQLKSGQMVHIEGHWAVHERRSNDFKVDKFEHDCPKCGARVRTIRMPNGGWVHFEAHGGLQWVKHPCFYIGEGLSQLCDNETPDMFESSFYLEP